MELIAIRNLPKLRFAHIYSTPAYRTHFVPEPHIMEITCITEGHLTLQTGNEKIVYGKGDVACQLRQQPVDLYTDIFHCHHTVGIAADWAFTPGQPDNLQIPNHIPAGQGGAEILRLIDGIIHRRMLYRSSETKAAAAILELLCAVDHYSRKRDSAQLRGDQLYAQRAKEYIQQHLHMPIAQNEVAAYLGISAGYLCSVFKNTEGISLMRYINTVKLEEIRSLMENEEVPLYRAAALYGYSDANYVSKLHKQIFGYNISEKAKAFLPKW